MAIIQGNPLQPQWTVVSGAGLPAPVRGEEHHEPLHFSDDVSFDGEAVIPDPGRLLRQMAGINNASAVTVQGELPPQALTAQGSIACSMVPGAVGQAAGVTFNVTQKDLSSPAMQKTLVTLASSGIPVNINMLEVDEAQPNSTASPGPEVSRKDLEKLESDLRYQITHLNNYLSHLEPGVSEEELAELKRDMMFVQAEHRAYDGHLEEIDDRLGDIGHHLRIIEHNAAVRNMEEMREA